MTKIKQFIPNAITLGNLMCGVESVFSSLALGNTKAAALWICAGIFLDFFDGLSARLLKVPSELGKQLDSLADVVTSGVAPAFLMYTIMELPASGLMPRWALMLCMMPFLLMPAFAAYRLAKFNIDTRQSHSFLGLPVPSNALVWVGFALSGLTVTSVPVAVVIAVVGIMGDILMVSELPLFSLKFNFKDMAWRSNRLQYIFLICCAAIIALLRNWIALSAIILFYIALSLFTQPKQNA
ncbi:MAG: CDP-alcohol phosphatidyltransferase family protein [Bacteroidales bacterium]|nr:CDP-alcohol phosphatidyltransferase family protein [Bacteroidales bacterium]